MPNVFIFFYCEFTFLKICARKRFEYHMVQYSQTSPFVKKLRRSRYYFAQNSIAVDYEMQLFLHFCCIY